MKRLLFLSLLLMTTVGCVPVYIIFFGEQEFEIRPECFITVASYSPQPTFFTDPLNYPALVNSDVMESQVSEENGDLVLLFAIFGITRYALIDGEYWFEVNLDGRRQTLYAFLEEEAFVAIDNNESIADYIMILGETFEDDRLNGGRYWIPESVVIRRPERLGETLCYWHILNDTFDELGIPEQSECVVYPVEYGNEVRFRVGAGENRAVRFQSSADFTFRVLGYGVVDGTRWYQVEAQGYTEPVWVHDDDVYTVGNCDDILPAQSPPIVPNTNNSNDLGSCDNFRLLGMSGAVPDGMHTFRWTLVNGATEYIVHFYDYQGNRASVHSVDVPALTVHTGSLGTGSQLSMEVFAMRGGDILCGTGRSSSQERLAAQSVPEPEPSATPVEDDDDDDNNRRRNNGGGYTPPEEYIPPGE